jgi:hypothetical protein
MLEEHVVGLASSCQGSPVVMVYAEDRDHIWGLSTVAQGGDVAFSFVVPERQQACR